MLSTSLGRQKVRTLNDLCLFQRLSPLIFIDICTGFEHLIRLHCLGPLQVSDIHADRVTLDWKPPKVCFLKRLGLRLERLG